MQLDSSGCGIEPTGGKVFSRSQANRGDRGVQKVRLTRLTSSPRSQDLPRCLYRQTAIIYQRCRRERFIITISFNDILVLERLPDFLPIVGGTITEELQTPLAHVNVAARTRGTPNIALLETSQRPEIAPLIGELVRFEVGEGAFRLEKVELEEAREFWEGRNPESMVPEFDHTV